MNAEMRAEERDEGEEGGLTHAVYTGPLRVVVETGNDAT